jgi:alkylation response protein AidB-like acyl-CoA dehydrogenase
MSDAELRTDVEAKKSVDEFRERARSWLEGNLPKRDGTLQRRHVDYYTESVLDHNREIQRLLFEAGFAGITWPTEYGGLGLTAAHQAAFLGEAKGYELPDFGVLGGTTFDVCIPTMLAHAQPVLLRDVVPKVLRGELLMCQFFSEPSAGSDLAAARTTATRDGETWRLNGQKTWSTFAHLADWGLCLARTDWEAPKHRGLTWFAVDCRSKGLTIRPIRRINGSAEFCDDFFDDVDVPDRNRVGEPNQGWQVTQTMLVYERGAGRARRPVELTRPGPLAPDLVELARRSGRTQDPLVRQKIAQGHVIDFVGEALQSQIDGGARRRLTPGIAAYGKLFRGTYNPIRARLGVDIGGIDALVWSPEDPEGFSTSEKYLNGRIQSIAGGSNEMQRNAIGEQSLQLPREPSFDRNKPFRQVLRDAQSWQKDAGGK